MNMASHFVLQMPNDNDSKYEKAVMKKHLSCWVVISMILYPDRINKAMINI